MNTEKTKRALLPFAEKLARLTALVVFVVTGWQVGQMLSGSQDFFEALNTFTYGMVGAFAGLIFYGFFEKRAQRALFERTLSEIGIKPDFLVFQRHHGVAIDLKNERIFAGSRFEGNHFELNEVEGVETEDRIRGRKADCVLRILTSRSDHYVISVRFGPNRDARDNAFSRLAAQINKKTQDA